MSVDETTGPTPGTVRSTRSRSAQTGSDASAAAIARSSSSRWRRRSCASCRRRRTTVGCWRTGYARWASADLGLQSPAVRDQAAQLTRGSIGPGTGRQLQHGAVAGEQAGVERIGLRRLAERASEGLGPLRGDHDHREARGAQRVLDVGLVAARGLDHDLAHLAGPQRAHERPQPRPVVREALDLRRVGEGEVEEVGRDVDPGCQHGSHRGPLVTRLSVAHPCGASSTTSALATVRALESRNPGAGRPCSPTVLLD